MADKWSRLITDERGQGMTEYGLVMGGVAVVVVVIILALRSEITLLFQGRLDDIVNRPTE